MTTNELTHQKEMVTQESTPEEVILFLESCVGETIILELEDNGHGSHGTSHALTFLVKLLSVSMKKRKSDGYYEVQLYSKGHSRLAVDSRHPFSVKKSTPANKHTF